MKHKIIIIILFLIFVASNSYDQDYKFLALTQDSVTEYNLLPQSLVKGNSQMEGFNYREVWIKRTPAVNKLSQFRRNELKRRQNEKLNANKYKNYTYTLERWQFSCENRRLRVIESLDYDSKGNAINIYKEKDSELPWNNIVPESLGEYFSTIICNMDIK